MSKLLALLAALIAPLALAQEMNRFGTMVQDDDGGGYSNSPEPLLFLLFVIVLTFVLYRVLKAIWPQNSTELNANLAWIAAMMLAFAAVAIMR